VAKNPNKSEQVKAVAKAPSDYYVLTSAVASRRTVQVLANGHSFAVFDAGGDILPSPNESLGFFHRDTRYLNHFEINIAGQMPYLLNSNLDEDNAQLRVNLTNPDLFRPESGFELRRDSIQLERSWILNDFELLQRVKLRNFAGVAVHLPVEFFFGVDFVDVFEVRGLRRHNRGQIAEPVLGKQSLRYQYTGLDGVVRTTEIVFRSVPKRLADGYAVFEPRLEPNDSAIYEIGIKVRSATGAFDDVDHRNGSRKTLGSFNDALNNRHTELASSRDDWAGISAGNELFNSFLHRSIADLSSIVSYTADGAYIMAGIPWFATLFGRDSLITAMSVLPFNPSIAVGTLRTLAALQGDRVDDLRDEQPGKIVHEVRYGEMAATNEVPFGRYYGSIDSTPLFLWLLGRCVMTTGNLELAEQLWPKVERALNWIELWGDRDGDGYVEYLRATPRGLANQGWKDSDDAVTHADGQIAKPPIALSEVQAYVYAAYTEIADIAKYLGRSDFAMLLHERAARLKSAFVRDFWLDRERTVALALDADKAPCRVLTSNAGHCLAAGLLDDDYAATLADQLVSERMFSGWGVRTLAVDERRYNPMSYHNGSVWPHDNGILATGLARYGNRKAAAEILQGMFEAANRLGVRSLPELFCGFAREERLGPAPYPVACYPQAWSAASIFAMLSAIMGLQVVSLENRVLLDSPKLPNWLESLTIQRLKVGQCSVSFKLQCTDQGTALEVIEKRGPVVIEIRH
jgi:glycogen debranching enzyme